MVTLTWGLLAVMSAMLTVPAGAAAYPSRPVELVAPYRPGGPADVLARALAQAAQRHLGQTVVVINSQVVVE